MTEQEFADGAWYSFVLWACGFAPMRAEYTRDTGHALSLDRPAARTPIDRMIDKATQRESEAEKDAAKFILWVTKKHWGLANAPKKYRDSVRKKRRKL